MSKRVNSSRTSDDDVSLLAIDGAVATSDEFIAATMSLAAELRQFGPGSYGS